MSPNAKGKIKALHLLKTSVGATWAFRQTRELVNLGVDVHLALPPGPLIDKYRDAGITVHPLYLDASPFHPVLLMRTLRSLRTLISSVKPDIIHSHFVITTLLMRLALGRSHPTARIFQVPGPLHLERFYSRWIEMASSSRSDYWIGSCKWTCDRYRKSGVGADRVFLSYYGIDIDQYVPRSRGKLRRELNLDDTVKLVGMVSFMYPPKWYALQARGIKGHEDLIDALAICLRNDPQIRGIFIGGAWNKAHAYENYLRRYGHSKCGDNVIFLGTRNDVPDLYPDLDVVVHPSHSENVGAASESLPMAIPTIATNIGGFPDVVKDGETGWLVPRHDPKRLSNAIIDALRDPMRSRERALKGQALVRKLMDVRENARQILEIYRKILENAEITSKLQEN